MRIELDRCVIRDWRADDAAALRRHADDRRVWINLRDRFPHPYTLRDARDWIEAAGAPDAPVTDWAIEVDGEAAGGIGLTFGSDVARRSAEIGFWLGASAWGRGIMTAAVVAVTDRAFAAHDLCRVHATVFEWNPASMRVLEKAGYRREGRLRVSVTKDGRTVDSILYARTIVPGEAASR
jgi:RimJ/RimL family protein N-acetyltransferase